MTKQQMGKNYWAAGLASLGWPLLTGAAACSVFYVLVSQGPLNTPFMHRYFASHPVLYVETGMFFVGLAALLLKLGELCIQSSALRKIHFETNGSNSDAESCQHWLSYLESLPRSLRGTYLAERLHSVLSFVARKDSAEGLDEELKYLSDLDSAKQQEGYALVRMVAWATPMLGFLGTVIGITQALGDLDPQLFATDVKAAMQGLLAGLYVAFDTTALALVLSMLLMFLMFFADRIESQILTGVDVRVTDEVAARFSDSASPSNPYLKNVERMGAAVIKTTETLIKQQTEQWKAAIEHTQQQLGNVAQETGQQIRLALGESLDESLKNHAERLARFEFEADQQMRSRWDQWQSALAENVRVVREQQTEVTKQTDVLAKIAVATADIVKLEQALNGNLNALAGSRNFEETLLTLSAAIQLLSARLNSVPERGAAVDLRSSAQGRAA